MNQLGSGGRVVLAALLATVTLALAGLVWVQWQALSSTRQDIARSEEVAAEASQRGGPRIGAPLVTAPTPEVAADRLGALLGELGLKAGAVQPAGQTRVAGDLVLSRFTVVASGDPAAVVRLSRWIARNPASAAIDRISVRAPAGGATGVIVQADMAVLTRSGGS